MRDFSQDHSALALNTASLGHNLEGYGAGWSPEQVIDACAARGYGGIVFWRREIGVRAQEIGDRVRAAGLQVAGLCRTPFLTGPLVPGDDAAIMDDFRASIDMAAALGTQAILILQRQLVLAGRRWHAELVRRAFDEPEEPARRVGRTIAPRQGSTSIASP